MRRERRAADGPTRRRTPTRRSISSSGRPIPCIARSSTSSSSSSSRSNAVEYSLRTHSSRAATNAGPSISPVGPEPDASSANSSSTATGRSWAVTTQFSAIRHSISVSSSDPFPPGAWIVRCTNRPASRKLGVCDVEARLRDAISSRSSFGRHGPRGVLRRLGNVDPQELRAAQAGRQVVDAREPLGCDHRRTGERSAARRQARASIDRPRLPDPSLRTRCSSTHRPCIDGLPVPGALHALRR